MLKNELNIKNKQVQTAIFINSDLQLTKQIPMPRIEEISAYLNCKNWNYFKSKLGFALIISAENDACSEQAIFKGFTFKKDANIDVNGNAIVIGLPSINQVETDHLHIITSDVSDNDWNEPPISIENLNENIIFLNNQLSARDYFAKLKMGLKFNNEQLGSFIDIVYDIMPIEKRFDCEDYFENPQLHYEYEKDEVVITFLEGKCLGKIMFNSMCAELYEQGVLIESQIINLNRTVSF